MARPAASDPSDVELQILEFLWEHGPSTIGEVHDGLGAQRGVGYSTTQRMLNFMADKGLLERDASVRPAVYRAAKDQATTKQGMLDRLLQKAFGGSASKMLVQLLDSKDVSGDELAEVKRLIRERERKQKRKRRSR